VVKLILICLYKVKRKTKEVLVELLSSVPSLANCSEDKRIGKYAPVKLFLFRV